MTRLVLASGSPRRAELLRTIGLEFSVVSPEIDETVRPGEEPAVYVERLARQKAAEGVEDGAVALGADTTIVHAGRILGKPGHPNEAVAMLRSLSGDTHQVFTAVATARIGSEGVMVESVVESALVRFLPLVDSEIAAYVATGEPLDRAGAYAIQERGGLLVESIEGHPSTVIGLPLPATRRLLARAGLDPLF